MSNRRRTRPPASQPGRGRATDLEQARAEAHVTRQLADQAAAQLARLEGTQEPSMAPVQTSVAAQLDQVAARINSQRDTPHAKMLVDHEQRLMAELIAAFPELDVTLIGGVLLFAGAKMAEFGGRLPDELKPQAGPVIVGLLQMAGQSLWDRNPPIVWHCPHTLVGGKPCPKVLTARDEEQLAPRVAGHLELSHPDTRAERRA